MSELKWLHLTDLHFGLSGQAPLWPNVKQAFFDDLEYLYDRTGPWQLVFFSGDFVQQGLQDEFQKTEDEVLAPLWDRMKVLGSQPKLLAVPGNHDLVRPDSSKPTAALRLLLQTNSFHEIADEFFASPGNEYRILVRSAFRNYMNWWQKTPLRPKEICDGLIPGDFSYSLDLGESKIGIVGLNTTFLQLSGGDFIRRLALDVRQLHGACTSKADGDGPSWLRQHDLSILMTHQGPDWLDEHSRNVMYPEINPFGRFALHLFGHMHENVVRGYSFGGGKFSWQWQGNSLFGMQRSDSSLNNADRKHGYSAGTIKIGSGVATIRHWPRKAWKDENGWRFDRDSQSCVLDRKEDDGGTEPVTFPVSIKSKVEASKDKTTSLPNKICWPSAVLYPLQPAQHFSGRTDHLKRLLEWAYASDHTDRVVALVAAGGTGKTALVERVLAQLPSENTFGVLVWSFYDNPKIEAFLRAACEYFLGTSPKEVGGLFEYLQHGLREAQLPHLLILDGLELVQSSGTTRRRGELEDPIMRRFLCWLAAGHDTKVKALVTSRYPLNDLDNWQNNGYSFIELHDLDTDAARAILRRRGVQGSDAALDILASSVGYHALTVDVLGLYLHRFGNDNPKNADKFDLKAASGNQKGEKLARVLASYAAKLPNDERDLLARLSLFPNGVTVEDLSVLVSHGGDVAGALAEYSDLQLIDLLANLTSLGLVFLSGTKDSPAYSAHPFLRDFFSTLLGAATPEQVNAAIRNKLAPNLEERPEHKPTDQSDLDRYERLIEITRRSGQAWKAFDLYWYGLGGYEHLGKSLAENTRGLRILMGFLADDAQPSLLDDARVLLMTDYGLFSKNLGDLESARRAFEGELSINESRGHNANLSAIFQNICDVELAAGRWREANDATAAALTQAEFVYDKEQQKTAHARFGAALTGFGSVKDAHEHFLTARKLQYEPILYSLPGFWEAELKLAIGNCEGAKDQTLANRSFCCRNNLSRSEALCDTLLGLCMLPKQAPQARIHLNAARKYADRSGNVEVILRCHHLAARIARCEKELAIAESEAMFGIQVADSCGFGHWSLVIRHELAEIHLAAGKFDKAIEVASDVLIRSEAQYYRWGIADSEHLLGVAYARLNCKTDAKKYLDRAILTRAGLQHPGLETSKAERKKLGAASTYD